MKIIAYVERNFYGCLHKQLCRKIIDKREKILR